MANFELVIWNDEGYRCTEYALILKTNEIPHHLAN
jgi:hypothetical protein